MAGWKLLRTNARWPSKWDRLDDSVKFWILSHASRASHRREFLLEPLIGGDREIVNSARLALLFPKEPPCKSTFKISGVT
jgi:hypothetical protein